METHMEHLKLHLFTAFSHHPSNNGLKNRISIDINHWEENIYLSSLLWNYADQKTRKAVEEASYILNFSSYTVNCFYTLTIHR